LADYAFGSIVQETGSFRLGPKPGLYFHGIFAAGISNLRIEARIPGQLRRQQLGAATQHLDRIRAAQPQLGELLYDAAANPAAWQSFMQALIKVTASRSARLLVLDKSGTQVDQSLKVNIDDGYHRQYVDYYVNACPWRPELAEKPAGRLYSTFLDFSCKQQQFLQSEFYTDWARPQNIHHGLCGTLHEDADQKIQFLIQRTNEPGHYTRQERDHINASLVPHIRRVCQLNQLYTRMEGRSEAIAAAAGQSPLPFILLGADTRVTFASPGAEALIRTGGNLDIEQEQLIARTPRSAEQLQQLIKTARDSALGRWDSAGGVLQIERAGQPPLTLLISPVAGHSTPLLFAPRRSYVAIFIHDPAQHPELSTRLLQQLYQLTPAEARVAAAIARGYSLEHLASREHRSVHTLRSQLKAVFQKTGTSRQNELAHLILTGPGGHIRRQCRT
jgi:DNA-binding CsgD family transcriptional regulator